MDKTPEFIQTPLRLTPGQAPENVDVIGRDEGRYVIGRSSQLLVRYVRLVVLEIVENMKKTLSSRRLQGVTGQKATCGRKGRKRRKFERYDSKEERMKIGRKD